MLQGDGRYVLNDFDYSNADVVSSSRDNAQHQKAWGVNLNGEWKNDDWRLNAVGTFSKASNNSVEVGLDAETLQTAAGNGVNGTLHSGAGNLDDFSFSLNPNPSVSFPAFRTGSGAACPPACHRPI